MNFAIVIPFRDRGRDPLRQQNLDTVLKHWSGFDVLVVDDGRDGDEQFNRSAAYNRGAVQTDADVLVYAESDILISHDQIHQATELAQESPGLVVPFNQFRGLNEADSVKVRDGADPAGFVPELVIPNRHRKWLRTGPVNVISRETLNRVGRWDETFEGSWWDDRSMQRAFEVCCGPTRMIEGPAFHLYHLPGWQGQHLTAEDKRATNRNRLRYYRYMEAETPEQIRQLTEVPHG